MTELELLEEQMEQERHWMILSLLEEYENYLQNLDMKDLEQIISHESFTLPGDKK